MATVEEHVEQEINRAENGPARAGEEIAVENPATGQTVGTVPDLGAEAVAEMAARGRAAHPGGEADGFDGRGGLLMRARERAAEMAARGRAAQPGWEAYGFDGRGRILMRAQKWVMDNSAQVIETIMSE